MNRSICAVATILGAALSGTGPSVADPIADFYQGKQLSFISSASEGGGIGGYATAFAPYFSAHIPGNPRIVVQTMPGAGGLRAMQYFAGVAQRDGTGGFRAFQRIVRPDLWRQRCKFRSSPDELDRQHQLGAGAMLGMACGKHHLLAGPVRQTPILSDRPARARRWRRCRRCSTSSLVRR